MYVSAELRWFWQSPPIDLYTWFCDPSIHTCAVGGGTTRDDAYILDALAEIGIKRRGEEGVEVKGLVDVLKEEPIAPFSGGPIEIWSKWSVASLTLVDPLIVVTKQRWVRQFATPDQPMREIALDADEHPIDGLPHAEGCNVEYAEVSIFGHRPWFSFGFEAFGSLATVASSLRLTMARLAELQPPPFTDSLCLSYPAWIARLTQRRP